MSVLDRVYESLFARVGVVGRSCAGVWETEPYYYGGLMDVGMEFGLPCHPGQYRALPEEMRRCDPGG
jgi:hypothetical protein